MKKTITQQRYAQLVALYEKLNERLNKHFRSGRFSQFTSTQQARLLSRIERIKEQLYRLERKAQLAGVAIALTGALYTTSSNAQVGPVVGAEFTVNTYTTASQGNPKVAMDSDGDFVIAWQSQYQAACYACDSEIYAQRFNASGIAQGSEFRINTYLTQAQYTPAVAMDDDGDFVVVWASNHEGSSSGIYAQRYNASGVAQGTEFKVNSHTTNTQNNPAVAMDSDGDFVVVWTSDGQDGSSHGIYAQRYNASGTTQGGEFQVNVHVTDSQANASIAMDDDGDFIIVWHTGGQEHNYGIYGRRYNAAGVSQGTEFLINTYTTGAQITPVVAMDSDGDFVVAWQSYNQDSDRYGIYAQRFDETGVAQGNEFKVNTYTSSGQDVPTIAMDSDGDFVVSWRSETQGESGYNVFAQLYNAAGVTQGSEFQVNTFESTTGNQFKPAVAMDSDGEFVITWHSTQDGADVGIDAQRFSTNTTSVQENSINDNTLQLFPNPAEDFVLISGTNGITDFKIMDTKGSVRIEKTISSEERIDISGLNVGLYFVHTSNEAGDKTVQKLMVQKR